MMVQDRSEWAAPKSHRGEDGCAGGCLKGCAVVVLLVVVVFFGFWFWLSRPGGQRPTAGIVSERSAGVVHFAPTEADPGVEALRQGLRTRIESELSRGEGLPGPLRSLLSEIADRFVPTELTLSLEPPSEAEEPVELVAFNPKGYTRLLRFFAYVVATAEGDEEAPAYRGADIYRVEDDSYVAFIGGTVLLSESERVLLRGIDRLEEAQGEEGDEDGGEDGEGEFGTAPAATTAPGVGADGAGIRVPPPPEGGWDLTGWFEDGSELAREVREESDDDAESRQLAEALAEAGALAFGADFETGDRLTGKLWIEAGSPEGAVRLAEALRRHFAKGSGLDATLTLSTRGTRVEGELVAVAVADSIFGPSKPE